MFGGLVFEVLSGGLTPFFWKHSEYIPAYRDRIGGVSTLEAGREAGHNVAWKVGRYSDSDEDVFAALLAVMQRCLRHGPEDRPTVTELVDWFSGVEGVAAAATGTARTGPVSARPSMA